MVDDKHIVEFAPGDIVIQENTPANALYIVKEGQLEVFKVDGRGRIIPVAIIASGEFLGETALLLNKSHSANVRALTSVKLHRISRESFESQLKAAPGWFVAMMKGLAERLQATNELIRKNKIIDSGLSSHTKAVKQNVKKSS